MLSVSHASFLQRIFVRSELDHLYAVCYYLQRRAMICQQPQTLSFDVSKQRYHYNNRDVILPRHVRFGCARGVKGPPSAAQDVIRNPVTFKNNKITFHPDGIIQAGAVYLTDSYHRFSYALSCAVAHVSYLRKYQYTGKWIPL